MLRAKAGELIHDARKDVAMTQMELAAAAGIHQPTLAAYESGRRHPSEATLNRILTAARMRPSIPLTVASDEIKRSARRHNLGSVRVFGSVLTGDDTPTSDIDLLVETGPHTSLFDLGRFANDVEMLTGFSVDVITEQQARSPHFRHVLDGALPL
ncbi:MAG TPA: nucleotidyltransferase domain-containing protein [Microbacteriaceae bacterium]